MLDEEGIDQALLFPSIHLLWGDIRDPVIAAETCRAYNDWISDFCKESPARLFAMGIVPLQDVELAVAEAKRLARLGLRGLVVRPERFDGLALYDPALRRAVGGRAGRRSGAGACTAASARACRASPSAATTTTCSWSTWSRTRSGRWPW